MSFKSIGLAVAAASLLAPLLAACSGTSLPPFQPSTAARPQFPSAIRPAAKGFGVLYGFSGSPPFGRDLAGGVIVDKDGNLFGATKFAPYSDGGYGGLFELQPSGGSYAESNIVTFSGSNGATPGDRPIEDASGNLFVTTSGGTSSSPYGSVNKFTHTGSGWSQSAIDLLGSSYSFSGRYPEASPVETGGTIYVPTTQGGYYGEGAILALNPATLSGSVLYSFEGPGRGDLESPYAALVADSHGVLYGTAESGGEGFGSQGGGGGVYTLTGGNKYAFVFQFPAKGSDDFPQGAASEGSLVLDKSGHIYGTTILGGSYAGGCSQSGCGVVFKLTKSGSGYTIKVLHAFAAGKDGYEPHAGLTLKGKILYGTTVYGGNPGGFCGAYGCGTLFKVSTSGSGYKVLHRFQGTDGANPGYGSLTLVGSVLYGTTLTGDFSNGNSGGVVYKWTL